MPKAGLDAAPARRARLEPSGSDAIAPRRTRAIAVRWLGWSAAALFVALAVVAHSVAYFPIDIAVTHALQAYHGRGFELTMIATSWLGFFPQAAVLSGLVTVTLFTAGLRWEAGSVLFATLGGGLGALVKLAVRRPRPGEDLAQVFQHLASSGFPSGHVLATTAFCGFLGFLVLALLAPSAGRTALIVMLAVIIALMGPSRIYLGQHWFSDVVGGLLLGGVWLALTIRFYRWGEARGFGHRASARAVAPVASA